MRRFNIGLCAALVPMFLTNINPAATAADIQQRITGPHTAQNLAIYFIHGPSQPGPIPLTLKEALASGVATVFETGQVSRLVLQNTGDREVFVQAGDIVKGGRQDRVLTVSLLIPPRSGKIPIGAYCVEQGRWKKRGAENVANFQSANSVLPSKAAKLAIFAPRAKPTPHRLEQRRIPHLSSNARPRHQQRIQRQIYAGARTRQQQVWASVGKIQSKLSRNLAARMQSDKSKSSLQLTLEHKTLIAARKKLIAALKQKTDTSSDIVGYVFAINGRLNSADIYPSNGLFRKMWPKLLAASATEALAEKDNKSKTARPSIADVRDFLKTAEKGKSTKAKLTGRLQRETRAVKGKGLYLATRRHDGTFVHRSYLAY